MLDLLRRLLRSGCRKDRFDGVGEDEVGSLVVANELAGEGSSVRGYYCDGFYSRC